MKKLFLLMVLSVAGWSQIGLADVTCETYSRGYSFTGRGWDERSARDNAIRDCRNNRNTDVRECDRNISCRDERDDGRWGQRGRIWASPSPCYSYRGGLCTTYVEFEMGNDQQIGIASVIVLDDRGSREQIFACHMGRSPANPAPWIAPGKRYEFKLYAVRSCEEGIRYGRVVDSYIVEGR